MDDLQLLNPIQVVQGRHQGVTTLSSTRLFSLLCGLAFVLIRQDGVRLIREERHSCVCIEDLSKQSQLT